MKKYYPLFFPLFLLAAFCVTSFAHAATMAIQPVAVSGGTQVIAVTLDTQGQSINAIAVHLTFDPSEFAVSGVTDAGSIVDLLIAPPTFSNGAGTVDFSGIIPGGANVSRGTVVNIAIVPKENGMSAGFDVASATALLNDGRGTPAPLTVASGPFAIALSSSTPMPAIDTQPPAAFTPEIGRSPALFGGQYFLSFSTTDQRSGINHYEVLEVPTGTGVKSSGWQTAQSPYLLQDQTLSSDIYVRAVDNAGNFRIEEVPALHPASPATQIGNEIELFVGSIVVLLILGGALWIWKRKRRS